MARKAPRDVLAPRMGLLDAGWALTALENAGYAVITKSEHLELRRAKIKLAKLETNGSVNGQVRRQAAKAKTGARTGRMSLKEPNLSTLPIESKAAAQKATKPIKKASATKVTPAKERAKATKTNVAAKKVLPRKRVTRKGL